MKYSSGNQQHFGRLWQKDHQRHVISPNEKSRLTTGTNKMDIYCVFGGSFNNEPDRKGKSIGYKVDIRQEVQFRFPV
jgi:hypothetical protein